MPDLQSLFGRSGPVKHVIILMQENRAFDEYFGVFPGADGLASLSQAQVETAWPGNGNSPSPQLPYRLSSFTSPVAREGIQDHNVEGQHISWAGGALNGWSNNGFNDSQCVAYFAEDDLPFHWWLARNFLLCDRHFSSVIGNTLPNRLYLMTGTAIDPTADPTTSAWPQDADTTAIFYSTAGAGANDPADYQAPLSGYSPDNPNNQQGAKWIAPTWNTYPDCLAAAGFTSWKIYNGRVDPDPDVDGPMSNGDMSVVTLFPSTWQTLFPGNPPLMPSGNLPHHASATATMSALDQLVADIQNNALPQVSWMIPQVVDSEWPAGGADGAGAPWNGAVLISTIYKALLANPDLWASTVFILTYDENDGHYDHVPPTVPGPPQSSQPATNAEEFLYMSSLVNYQPIGAGFRVPTIIISPWTFQGGICSLPFDHTSTLRLLEEFTGVLCTTPGSLNTDSRNISDWRVATFPSLSAIPIGGFTDAGSLPVCPDAVAIQAAVIARQNAAPANASTTVTWPEPPALATQTWPPVAQSCELIMPVGSYDLAQANKVATGSSARFPGALQVMLIGFEPYELTHPNAVGAVLPNVPVTGGGTCSTRVPTITFSDPSISVDVTTVSVDQDPNSISTVSGIPVNFTFTYDLVLTNLGRIFPPMPTTQGAPGATYEYSITVDFQVDASYNATGELELVSTADPQFYKNFTDDTVWLSGELVVFSLHAGKAAFGPTLGSAAHPTQATSTDALTFIQKVINNLNGSSAYEAEFDALNAPENANTLTIALPVAGAVPVFNFALARVHMNSTQQATNVRVFFRCCRASVTTGQYDATGTDSGPSYSPAFYRSNPAIGASAADTKIPLLGVTWVPSAGAVEYTAIPFFATPRINLDPTQSMAGQLPDTPNIQPNFPVASGGNPGVAYFGCWLDINQPDPLIPATPPSDTSKWDGPFPASSPPLSIQRAFFNDMHQCLVAEISYDAVIIPQGDAPGASAWLAQRNLGLTQ